jgi:hypothetical protein
MITGVLLSSCRVKCPPWTPGVLSQVSLRGSIRSRNFPSMSYRPPAFGFFSPHGMRFRVVASLHRKRLGGQRAEAKT